MKIITITKGRPFVFWGLVIGQLNMGTLMTATRPVVRIKGHNRLVFQTCFKEASVILLDPSHLNSIRCIGDGSKLIVDTVMRAPLLYFIRNSVVLSFKVCQSVCKASVSPV